MTRDTGEAAQASVAANGNPAAGEEATLPDGHGGLITRTAPSTSGETFAGGTIVENDVGDSEEALIAAIEETIKPFEEGDLVTGTIVKLDKDETLVDIGYKSEGVIPARELSIRNDVDPSQVVQVGETVETLVLQKEDKEGRLILSKKRAQYERAWGRIEEIKGRDGTVQGPVIEVVKGGLILDIGLRGFLPASLVEMRRVRDLQPYVGKELECRIIELDKNRNNVVLSRRKFLEESQAEQRHEFLTSLQKGEVRVGTVSSIVNFGAFIDLGGVDGLVHVSELSWKHVDHPSEVAEVGQEVRVEVLDVDLERERVSLSLKATQEDPWLQFARRHGVGDVIEGRVTKLVPFGAFVEVDEAIEGLVHISELAEHHVDRAEDELTVHDRIPVKIIDIDFDRRRISLSRKQALRDDAEPDVGARSEAAGDMEVEAAEPDMELEARNTSESVGVATEDAIQRPESADELLSAAEAMPEMGDLAAPEAVSDPEEAGEAAPPEEREQAQATSALSPDRAPEEEAASPDRSEIETRLSQETPDVEVVGDEPAGPDLASDPEPVADPGGTGEQSIESIVEDLKRERGQA
jgi:small subunit ribosomal protein S1